MKYFLLLSLFAATAALAEVPNPEEYRYHAHFSKYTCKSFKEETQAPDVFTEKELKFQYLNVDVGMKNAIISLVSTTDTACEYRVYYAIDSKNDILNYLDSSIAGDETCAAKKDDLDVVFKEGFRYINKYYYYFALKFGANFSNSCESTTGNYLVEFEMGKQ